MRAFGHADTPEGAELAGLVSREYGGVADIERQPLCDGGTGIPGLLLQAASDREP